MRNNYLVSVLMETANDNKSYSSLVPSCWCGAVVPGSCLQLERDTSSINQILQLSYRPVKHSFAGRRSRVTWNRHQRHKQIISDSLMSECYYVPKKEGSLVSSTPKSAAYSTVQRNGLRRHNLLTRRNKTAAENDPQNTAKRKPWVIQSTM